MAELFVFYLSDGRNRRHTPADGWPDRVGLGGWLHSETARLIFPKSVTHSTVNQTHR